MLSAVAVSCFQKRILSSASITIKADTFRALSDKPIPDPYRRALEDNLIIKP